MWPWLLLVGCDVPPDGVLSLAFQLEPLPATETRMLPPQAEVGVAPLAFAAAKGRCDCDVPARAVRCTFEGLPPMSLLTWQPLRYELSLIVGLGPVPARYDGRLVERDPGGRDPDAPPPPRPPPLPRASLGPVVPDPLGAAQRTITGTDVALANVVGGEVHVVVAKDGGQARYLVIDGRVGNLDQGQTPEPAPMATPGGHMH
jgi:hypothetical protein